MPTFDVRFIEDAELQSALSGLDASLNRPDGWYMSSHIWARSHGFVSAFPTFLWERSLVDASLDRYRWKTVCVHNSGASVVAVPDSVVASRSQGVSGFELISLWHLAAHSWAKANGYCSGLPTFYRTVSERGCDHAILCFPKASIDIHMVAERDLQRWMFPFFEFDTPNGKLAAAHLWASSNGYVSGYPTYESSSVNDNTVFAVACLR